jgi:hypothetical protein
MEGEREAQARGAWQQPMIGHHGATASAMRWPMRGRWTALT